MLVTDPLRHAVRIRPAHVAVADQRSVLTYAQLEGRVRRLAGALRVRCGLRPGSSFALLASNRAEFVELYYAAAAAGLVCVPLNYRLAGPEVLEILEDADARLLFAERAYEPIVAFAVANGFEGDVIWLDGSEEYPALLEAGPAAPLTDDARDSSEVILQIYTSGTTGTPKGVMLSHRNIVANSWHLLAERAAHPDDRYLNIGPLCHMGAGSRVFLLVHACATHVIHPRFDPERALRALLDGDANAALIVPAMVRQLIEAAAASGRSLRGRVRQITYGTAPMPTDLLGEALERLECDFQQGYGLTEAAPNLTVLPPADHLPGPAGYSPRLSSVGRETVGVCVRVVDEQDADCAPGNVGEVVARGENVMEGYWRRPDETAAALRGGWLRTGDLGRFDEDGYLYLVDRKKDMLVSGGFNVYPREIERQLESHPQVAEVAVVAAPDERWGEVPVAFVVPAGGPQPPNADELRAFCEERLARFKVPKRYVATDELPRNTAGKVSKNELRERLRVETPERSTA